MEIKIEPNRLASLSKRMMEHQNRMKNLQNSLERESGKMTSLLWQSEFPPPFTGQITGQNDMINQTSQRIVNTLEYQAAWLSYFAHKASGADGSPFSLKQAEAVLAKYDERFREPENSEGLDKVKLAKDAAGELSGVYDVQRAATGIDPATGEKLSGMDRVFSSGMVILGVTPVGKGIKAIKVARTADKMMDVVKEGRKVEQVIESANVVKNQGNLNKDLAKSYLRDIESKTQRKVNKGQIDHIKEALRNKNYEKLTPKETAKHRSKFTSSLKDRLIIEWEEKTGQKWPRYTEEVFDRHGEVARSIGQPYDAHHIIENNFGGPHEWWNVHPAKYPDEHQAGIHGKGAPSGKLFPRR